MPLTNEQVELVKIMADRNLEKQLIMLLVGILTDCNQTEKMIRWMNDNPKAEYQEIMLQTFRLEFENDISRN